MENGSGVETAWSNMVSLGSVPKRLRGLNKTWAYFCWQLQSSQGSPCSRGLPGEGGRPALGEKTPEAVITRQSGGASVYSVRPEQTGGKKENRSVEEFNDTVSQKLLDG